ncbi:hypothetical protein MMYC01_201190 [Madurella mycetomatis]|uniref:F-box domain-containing protein n=1 Tax=Madurella mycetomatis TaxID=100816 RepID=A0A175WFT4_9PEZI|nr:hypothetical protein MMYC01_201190 [Madurella mycetomatis]
MRADYAARELRLEQHVYEIRDGSDPDYEEFEEFEALLPELPRLDGYDAEYFYSIDLDLVDGAAITKAVTWGIEQGHANFQVVVLSVFEVALAEVSCYDDDEPFHTRETDRSRNPGWCAGTGAVSSSCGQTARGPHGDCENISLDSRHSSTSLRLPASRRAASKSAGIFPPELYHRILDFVDYDTWKTGLVVSLEFRSYCLSKFRLDDRMGVVDGPFVRLRHGKRLLSFGFEDMQTGKVIPMIRKLPHSLTTSEYNWMPAIGSNRTVLMLDTVVEFEPAEDVPVEADSDEEQG